MSICLWNAPQWLINTVYNTIDWITARKSFCQNVAVQKDCMNRI